MFNWNLSSAGRASALQAEGHRFEPCRFHYGEIAQLARAHGSYPWCRGFKSLSRYYQEPLGIEWFFAYYGILKRDSRGIAKALPCDVKMLVILNERRKEYEEVK